MNTTYLASHPFSDVLKCILFVFSLMLIGTSCQLKRPVVKEVKQVKLERFNPLSRQLTFSVTPVLHNPNGFTIWCDQLEMEFHLDDIPLGTAVSSERIQLAPKSDTEYTFSQETTVESLGQTFNRLLQQDSVTLRVQSKFHFVGENFDLSVPHTDKRVIFPKQELSKILLGF